MRRVRREHSPAFASIRGSTLAPFRLTFLAAAASAVLAFSVPVFAAGQLSVAEEPGVITVQFSGEPGPVGIPSWKAVLEKKNGGNITRLHVPADHPAQLASRDFWSISALAVRTSEDVETQMSDGRENYSAFEVERFEIIECAPEKIVIGVGGPSKHRVIEHNRTYIFTPRGVAIEGEITPLRDLSSIGLYPHLDLRQIADSHYAAVPMRTQGRHGWAYMMSSGSDSLAPLPSGVAFPLEVELKLRRETPTFVRFFVDQPFESSEGQRLFGHNNNDYLSPSSGRAYYEKLLILGGGPAKRGEKQSFKLRYVFETRE